MSSTFRSKLIPSLVLMVMCLTFVQNGEAQNRKLEKRARELTSEGDKQFRQKNYQSAIESYAQAIAITPNVGNLRFWKGLAHFYLSENEMALPEFDAALANGYSTPRDIYVMRWRIHFQNNDLDKALADVRSGLLLDPENQELLLAQGDIAFAKGSFQQALAAYKNYVQKNQSNSDVYLSLAKTHQILRNFREQTIAAEQAIQLKTRFPADAYLLAGDGYEQQMKFSEAVESFKKAVIARPDTYEPYRRLAEGYRALAKFDDAIETSNQALRLFPKDGVIYTNISWYYSLADRHQEAVSAAQTAIRYLPESQTAYTNLCRAYNDLKRHDLAITACNNALRIKPNDGETLYYLARATGKLGKAAESSRLTKRAITGLIQFARENPAYSDAYYLLGNAYFDDGQREKALDAYERCLQLSPNFVKALYNTALIYLDLRKKDRALVLQRRLEQLHPRYGKMLLDEINAS